MKILEQLKGYIWGHEEGDSTTALSPGRKFLQIAVMVGRDLLDGMITLHAMGLVYMTLLSMVPLLAVSISVLKGFGVHGQLEPALAGLLAPLGDQSVEVSALIVGFVDNMEFGVLGAVGLGLLIYTSISLIQKIESALNQTWRLQSSRSLMQRFSDYLSVIMVGPVLVFSAVGITASLSSNHIVEVLNSLPYMTDLLRLFGKVLPYLLIVAAFTFVYMLVPNTKVHIRSAFYGALIAGVLWEVSGLLFTSFVSGSAKYTAIYSGFAIVLVFMIWVYLGWIILLTGASISFYHQHPEQLNWKESNFHLSGRLRNQLVLQAMVNIARAHDRQSELVPNLENLAAYQKVPIEVLQRMLDALQGDGLIRQTDQDPPQYIPAASLQRIKLIDVLRSGYQAEDDGQTDNCRSDAPVSKLLSEIEQQLESQLGEKSMVEILQDYEDDEQNENSLV